MLTLKTPVGKLIGVGPKLATRLKKIGVEKVEDLLYHFPFRYDDFSEITPIIKAKPGPICIKGKILEIKNERSPRKRMFLTQAIIQDDTSSIKAIWFQQPFLVRILKKGSAAVFAGKLEYSHNGLTLQNPTYELIRGKTLHTGRIVPVYPETAGLTSKWLRKIINDHLRLTGRIQEYLPNEIVRKYDLISPQNAIKQIHFPDSQINIEKAKKRIAFDELFLLQLKMLLMKKNWQSQKAPQISLNIEIIKKLISKLPYKLTNAQRKAAWEILKDLEKIHPMNRLLEGDVGSGKTIVAAIAILVTAKSGYQSVLMAPTEVLAQQHFNHLADLLSPFGLKIGLLISSKADIFPNEENLTRSQIESQIKSGRIDVVIGTQSLISGKMNYKKIGLAIIDEQHRFGVKQRAELRKKAHTTPHLLSMSATPIPRSLTLALYGDLDLSVIDEMPIGREKIATYIVKHEKREKAYNFIADQIKEGRQVFVICPLIEESDKLGVKSAQEEFAKLSQEIFPHFKIGLLHGKMKSKEKEKVMADFKARKYDILVSTAVVEVGVDVLNASVMMIEGADRFGLAQLHQFRGRVGRGEYKSYCFLFTDLRGAKTYARLNALVQVNDGFKLAEKDLELRGPGEIYGVEQHGLADLKMASLLDGKMIKMARDAADLVINKGIGKYPKIEIKLKKYRKERRLE